LRPHGREPALISLSSLCGSRPPETEDGRAPLFVALWADGTLCWSEDRSGGGAPYRTARLPVERVEELHSKLCTGLEPEPARGRLYGVHDHSITDIAVRCGSRVLGLSSCIESFESDPRLVATDHGIESLEGRDRTAVLAQQSPAMRQFRELWRECVDLIWSAVPDIGDPLQVDHFEYAWK
jgi:hypothetical protein